MTQPEPFTVALVDLDGTITDSAPGITATLAWTLERMGLPVPPPTELLRFVGPPIMDGLRDIAHVTGASAREALGLYRSRYRERGAFDSSVYPDVPEALDEIGRTLPLALATSKPESQARRILEHFGLADRFTVLAGASDDETRSDKADVIAYCLARLAELGVDLARPVMIGDRRHDVEGAAAHGIPTVLVRWGYGSPAEEAGAIGVAETAADLVALVLGHDAPAA